MPFHTGQGIEDVEHVPVDQDGKEVPGGNDPQIEAVLKRPLPERGPCGRTQALGEHDVVQVLLGRESNHLEKPAS